MKKLKLFIILGVEFFALALMLVLIFLSGKKQYTVKFELNGGTLIAGDLEQSVTQGSDAIPPSAYKTGHYLRGWSGSYKKVTGDVTLRAIWEYETTPGIEYESKHTYAEITGCFDDIAGHIYIGAYYKDLKVLGIRGSAFENCDRITNIHLLSGILTVGKRAFADCDLLETIDLPASATSIDEEAFAGCKSLKEIKLPASLEELGPRAFADCKSLETVYISSAIRSIDKSAFEGCSSLKKIVFEDPAPKDEKNDEKNTPSLIISEYAFRDCASLEEINLPSHTLVIGLGAFSGCTALSEIVIPEKTAIIGDYAFDTEDLKINLYFGSADEIPFGWSSVWNNGKQEIIFGYKKDGTDTGAED